MTFSCGLLRRCCIAASGVVWLILSPPLRADAQEMFVFDWRVIGTVTRATEGSDQTTTTRHQRSGRSELALLKDPSSDVRFALDFKGPDGGGSGLVPRAAEDLLDPNFAFPNPLPPGLPPPDSRLLRGNFRRLADGVIPPAFEIVLSQTFVCRGSLATCGNVISWEVLFLGNARRSTAGPAQ